MLNHTPRLNWRLQHDQMRPSVLGRAVARKVAASQKPDATEDRDAGQAQRSPATDGQIHAFFDAWRTGDEAGQKEALNKIVQTWRADNASGGVPVYAHLPLPGDFARTLASFVGSAGQATDAAFDKVIGKFDSNVGTLTAQQIAAHMNADIGFWLNAHSQGDTVDTSSDRLHSIGEVARRDAGKSAPWISADRTPARPQDRLGLGRASNPVTEGASIKLDPREAQEDSILRASARVAGHRGYEIDPKRTRDLAPESGGVRTLPYDPEHDKGEVEPVVFPAIAVQAIRTFGPPALIGGATSVIAEWAANRDQATGWDYALAFLSGAASGVLNLKKGKATFDVLLAMGTSIAGDVLSERPVSVPRALGAGLGAYLMAKVAGRIPGASQGGGRVIRRLGEKYIREFLQDMFGEEFELTPDEMKELWEGFENHYKEQWNDYPPTHDLPLPI